MNGPYLTREHGRYRMEWGDPKYAILEFDLLRSGRDGEVTAEVTATATNGNGAVIAVSRLNLVGTRSRTEYANYLSKRDPRDIDWTALVEKACREVVIAYRAGAPAVMLRDVQPAEDAGFILPPLAVGRMPTILFGDGGSAKSMLALALAASIQTGRPYLGLEPSTTANVAYLDWEMDGHEHRDRLERMIGPSLPPLLYIPCSRPLADDVDRVRREIVRHDIGYLIVDSVALACDGPPEAAEVAIRFFGALRELGLGSFLVAHVNRSGDTDRPFGSAFWHNGARLTWYAKLEADVGGSTTVGLFCKKANTGPRAAPLGYRIDWQATRERHGDSIDIARADIRDIPDLTKHVPLVYRLTDAIRKEALTVAQLATITEETVDTVSRTLRRMRGKGSAQDVVGPDGITRWGLPLRIAS